MLEEFVAKELCPFSILTASPAALIFELDRDGVSSLNELARETDGELVASKLGFLWKKLNILLCLADISYVVCQIGIVGGRPQIGAR